MSLNSITKVTKLSWLVVCSEKGRDVHNNMSNLFITSFAYYVIIEPFKVDTHPSWHENSFIQLFLSLFHPFISTIKKMNKLPSGFHSCTYQQTINAVDFQLVMLDRDNVKHNIYIYIYVREYVICRWKEWNKTVSTDTK